MTLPTNVLVRLFLDHISDILEVCTFDFHEWQTNKKNERKKYKEIMLDLKIDGRHNIVAICGQEKCNSNQFCKASCDVLLQLVSM